MQNPTNIKLILFDIGNVLVRYNTEQLCKNFAEYCEHNYQDIYDYLVNFWVYNRLELGQLSIEDLYVDMKNRFNMFIDIYDFILTWVKDLKVNAEVKVIARLISDKFKIGILSNTNSLTYRYLVNNGMIDKGKFSFIFLSYKIGMIKPDIRIANYVSKQSGIAKPNILFIDDKEINVRSMQAGGICSIQYSNPTKLKNDLREMGIEL